MTAGAGDSDASAGAAGCFPTAVDADVGMGEAQYTSDNDSIAPATTSAPDAAEPEPPATVAGQGEEDEDYEDHDAGKQAVNTYDEQTATAYAYTEDEVEDAERVASETNEDGGGRSDADAAAPSEHAERPPSSVTELSEDQTSLPLSVAHAPSSESVGDASGRDQSDETPTAAERSLAYSTGSIDDMEASIDSLRKLAVEVNLDKR